MVACDMNQDTIGLINSKRLAAMKPTGVIINVARGRIIEETRCTTRSQISVLGARSSTPGTTTTRRRSRVASNQPFQDLDNVLLSATARRHRSHARAALGFSPRIAHGWGAASRRRISCSTALASECKTMSVVSLPYSTSANYTVKQKQPHSR